ncbi:hypothetical protein NA57DRAFT_73079 [Rhizodiscina lignyota]|uniref:Transcription factor IIIC 90kDa subunit N-terminal domain-containing protein n=1 Tax=Rhizodiscina lignyota TaxID=1504668 RepID=A0A9P4IIC0_9PEZI|nr:hypothetical protein NA57DRAFT_73079 [Rhizodiscina lignyota]
MPDDFTLNCWPNNINCFAWSQDGDLAVAGGEHVELLTPKFHPFVQIKTTDTLWHNVHIRINSFTLQEQPTLKPASFREWSIGEEISPITVVSLAWSYRGLSKQRRAVLGVLTSNLLLSIWESTSKPWLADGWRRTLVINHTLKAYFSTMLHTDKDKSFRRRVRIRAFVWGSTSHQHAVDSTSEFLAVCNDCDEIIILRVQLASSILLADQSPSAAVVAHFKASSVDDGVMNTPPLTFEEMMSHRAYRSTLSWSPWIRSESGESTSFLVYPSGSHIQVHKVSASHSNDSEPIKMAFDDPQSVELPMRDKAPISWLPTLSEDGTLRMVTFTQESVVCVTFHDDGETTISPLNLHSISDHWDMPSGVTFTDTSYPLVHFVFHLSTPRASQTTLSLLRHKEKEHECPEAGWRQQLRDKMAIYSAEHELRGNVKAKVYGITSSPFGYFTATCTSFHPGDQLEYTIPIDQLCSVDISEARTMDDEAFEPPSEGWNSDVTVVSSEFLTFALKRWICRRHAWDDRVALAEALWAQLSNTVKPGPSSDFSRTRLPLDEAIAKHYTSASPDIETSPYNFVVPLRQELFDQIAQKRFRIGRLIDASVLSKEPALEDDIPVLRHLCRAVDKLLPLFTGDDELSHRLARIFGMLSIMVFSDAPMNGADPSTVPSEVVENCDICDAPVAFDDCRSAKCSHGHRFIRCQLTFMTIQAPGITKYCGVCGKPFITEEWVHKVVSESHAKRESANTSSSLPSLALLLLATCDVCLYCGGKFVR